MKRRHFLLGSAAAAGALVIGWSVLPPRQRLMPAGLTPVLPGQVALNGWVKVAAALPQICADLRHSTLEQAWKAYCSAWHDDVVTAAVRRAAEDGRQHAEANRWQPMAILNS